MDAQLNSTRRQFLRILAGSAALIAVGPALPVTEPSVDQLYVKLTMLADVPVRSYGWVMHPNTYRELKAVIARANYYAQRSEERLARRIALGLPVGKP